MGNAQAVKFFETAGENMQERKGAPEALIIFTSKEVIEGEKQGEIRDDWFHTTKRKSVPKTIAKYLSGLLKKLEDENFNSFYNGEWIRYIHFIVVNYQDFNDCFPKCYTTINALKEKEIWINMVGGANPINASLILSAGFIEANAKTYYTFESTSSLLHPSIDIPDFSNPITEPLLARLSILPFFSLDLGKLTRKLKETFLGREKVDIREIESRLKELDLSNQYLKKLKSGGWIIEENKTAFPGEMLKRWNEMFEKVKDYPNDYPSWKKWAEKMGILYTLNLRGELAQSGEI